MIKVLQVEDSESYLLLFRALTKKSFNITQVKSLKELYNLSVEDLSSYQVIILDGQLPDGSGMEAVEYLKSKSIALLVGNSSSEEYNINLKNSGVHFTFPKDNLLDQVNPLVDKIKSMIDL